MNPARTATASKAADLIKSPPGLRDECVRRAHLALIEVEAADKDLQREFAHKMNPAKKCPPDSTRRSETCKLS
jgi:hypothetical protein